MGLLIVSDLDNNMDREVETVPASPPPPPQIDDIPDPAVEPPPPYPDPSRRRRPNQRRHTISRTGSAHEGLHTMHSQIISIASDIPAEDDVDERTRLAYLTPPSPSPMMLNPTHDRPRRARSVSQLSTLSMAPSLAHTMLSLFEMDDEDVQGQVFLPEESFSSQHFASQDQGEDGSLRSDRHEFHWFSAESWKRYFRPMGKGIYYRSVVHLGVVNFPFALAAWIYLFVFTLVGTTTLVALPLGALLCFLDLLGARAFARAELALQSTFHSPLSYPAPYPPRPIFTRYRELTVHEIETGRMSLSHPGLVRERSFYKNTYSMFTDPTSYQALFYFIVIKPAITILLLLTVLIFVVPCMVLILPAPAALRAARKLGKWQANVAVEGLYHAVR